MGCRRPEREYGEVCAFFFTQLVSADSPIEEVVKSNSYKPKNYRIMRKFKLLFVVLVASIFFMPSELFAQNNDLAKLRSLQEKYNSMLPAYNKGKLRGQQLDEFNKLGQEIKSLEEKINGKSTKSQSPSDLAEQIIRTIRDFDLEKELALFSEEEKLTNTLLSMAKSDERREALLKVYDFLNLVANSYKYGAELAQGHKGMERGKKEIELAEQIKKRMHEEGDKTFGVSPEEDVSRLRKKNGVLSEDGRTFTMNDGTVFTGYFKEELDLFGDSGQYYEVKGNREKVMAADELTPYHGTIKYANGTTDELRAGKSENAKKKAAKAAYEAEMKAVKSELAKLSQKYGAATINSLKTTGALKVGYSMTMLNDYLKVCNRYRTARVKAENGQDDPLGFHYFEPTVSEVLKYGKTANRVKLGGTKFANEWVLANCMVANGKIAAIYQNTTILAIKDL